MKKTMKIALAMLMFNTTHVFAQSDADMKAWQTYMAPGEVHNMLASVNGDWNEDITMWMDATAKPTMYKASVTNEMIMGGRYQLSKSTGTMMGMPFEGMSLTGYDNAKKIFTATWVDNFGTGTTTLEGPWNAATKSIEFKGKEVDPLTGKDMDVREVLKFIDNDTQQMQMFVKKDAAEMKTMEIKFTRKK